MRRTLPGRQLDRLLAFLRRERGQSIVEVALMLPLMAFTLLGGADMARAFAVQLAVQNGARAGAEGLALAATPTVSAATTQVQEEMDRTPGVTATSATINVTFTKADGSSPCTGSSSTSVAGTSSIATPCYGKVRVRYTFTTLIPWPGLPNTFNFDRTTMMRRYQ